MWPSSVGGSILLVFSILTASLATAAPLKQVPTIGVLALDRPPSGQVWKQRSVFLQELRHLGWREGENVTVEFRWVSGQFDRVGDLAAELVRLNVDVIYVGSTTLIRAVQHAQATSGACLCRVALPRDRTY